MAKEEETKETKGKGKPINLAARVTIIGSAKAKVYKPGKEYSVHPETAKRLVEKGEAEYLKKKSE
jgi:hypothetical protein